MEQERSQWVTMKEDLDRASAQESEALKKEIWNVNRVVLWLMKYVRVDNVKDLQLMVKGMTKERMALCAMEEEVKQLKLMLYGEGASGQDIVAWVKEVMESKAWGSMVYNFACDIFDTSDESILIQKLDESFMLKNELQNFIKSMNSVL